MLFSVSSVETYKYVLIIITIINVIWLQGWATWSNKNNDCLGTEKVTGNQIFCHITSIILEKSFVIVFLIQTIKLCLTIL